MTTKILSKKLNHAKHDLKTRFHVKALFVFGSVALGKARANSDIDLIVEYASDEVSLFDFLELKEYLEQLFKRKVDLVSRDAIKKWMAAEIESQAVRVA